MCVIIDRGHQCLLNWGRWAGRDATISALNYPRCSAEQRINLVRAGDHEVDLIAELVDRLVVTMLEDRKRLIAKFFYVDRLPRKLTAVRVTEAAQEQHLCGVGVVSESIVKDDLMVIKSMVGGVVLWTQ